MNTLRKSKFDMEQGIPPLNWKTVLVPVDFSAGSARATRLAAEIAQQNDGNIALVHVIVPALRSEDADFCFLDEAERHAAVRLNQWVATHLADFASEANTSVRVSPSLEFTILLEACRVGADVIVLSQSRDAMLGVHRTGWNAGASASHGAPFRVLAKARGILRHASCPIITVNEAFPKPRVQREREHTPALA